MVFSTGKAIKTYKCNRLLSLHPRLRRGRSAPLQSLAYAVGLAAAINLGGVFVSSDGEFKEPEMREHAPIFWFRPPKEKT